MKNDSSSLSPSLQKGIHVILQIVKTLPSQSGVYRMIGDRQQVLYVGKAKNLQKRVRSYTQTQKLPHRLKRMVSETHEMEIITTHTEAEALLLEANLIKKLKPRYNILLRDDKSSSFILIREDHPYPQILKHRGAKSLKGQYFGPFASSQAVNETIVALQKAFLLRTCSDSFFSSRQKPCLQYQIKRCSAPCVQKISQEEYKDFKKEAIDFLKGKESKVQILLAEKMNEASETLDYEKAAFYRDRIRALIQIQSKQDINIQEDLNCDVIGLAQKAQKTCIQVFFFRGGRNYGNQSYFPDHTDEWEKEEILSSFLGQFYTSREIPQEILISHPLESTPLLEEAFRLKQNQKVTLTFPQRGMKAILRDQAVRNAEDALIRHLAQHENQSKILQELSRLFRIDHPPERIEVYDNSHLQGRSPYGAMIVAGPHGFLKKSYRLFSIKNSPSGDDYAMMREVIQRRFQGQKKTDPWPDLLLIDGGMGQLNAVCETLDSLGISSFPVVAIAKGPDRHAGKEKFFMRGCSAFSLSEKDPVLYYLQRLRDEAHRFVITSHRKKRIKKMVQSVLDQVPYIGASRKKALLNQFGSVKGILEAGIKDLQIVPGISKNMAQKLYDFFQKNRS